MKSKWFDLLWSKVSLKTIHSGPAQIAPLSGHREIISGPDPLIGSEFHLIQPDLPRGAPDPPSSAPTSSGSALIQTQASFQIGIHVWVLRPDLASLWSMPEPAYWSGSLSEYSDWILSALIYAQASFLIWIFAWVLGLDLALAHSMPKLTARSRSLFVFSD